MTNQATSTDLATTTEVPAILAEVISESRGGLSRAAQYELVKTQIAPGCDDGELALFLYIAKARGLDVFAKQLYARKQNVWNSEKRQTESKMILITSIDGFRLKAARTGQHTKTDDAEFTYDEKKIGPLNPAGIVKCRVVVYRNDSPFPATVFWDEMRQSYKKDNIERLNATWEKMPHAMISKCSESLALRKAFPEELSNISVDDEVAFEAPVTHPTSQPAAGKNGQASLPDQPTASTVVTANDKSIVEEDWISREVEAEKILRTCTNQDELAASFGKLSQLLPKGKAPAESRQRIGTLFSELEATLPKAGEDKKQ